MKSILNRRALGATLLALVFALALAIPAVALATTGDWNNPVALPSLPWAQEQTGTLIQQSDPGDPEPYFEYAYSIALTKGQTVAFNSFMTDQDTGMYGFSASFDSAGFVVSHSTAPGAEKLTLMASRTGTYSINVFGSTVETFSLNASLLSKAPVYKLGSLSVPKTAKKNKSFSLSAIVSPDYDGVDSPINFVLTRKAANGKYKAYKTIGSTQASLGGSSTKFVGSAKLPKGSYHVVATFSDAAHSGTIKSSSKTVTVK